MIPKRWSTRRTILAAVAVALLAAACGGAVEGTGGRTTGGGGVQGGGGGIGGGLEEQGVGVPLTIQATQSNIPYCTIDGVSADLDLYEAKTGSGPHPVVVYVHGGAWFAGDKARERIDPETGTQLIAGWITALTNKGFTVAAINYALAPRYKFPLPIEQAKCAVRFLRANASKYNLDPNHFGAMGGSAGGQLVSLMGTTDTSAGWDVGPYPDQSSEVQAVVDLFGPADIALLQQEHPRANLSYAFGSPDQYATFSPITYVTADDAPTLIMQGNADAVVPLEQSQQFYDALQSKGVPTKLVVVDNGAHGFVPNPPGSTIKPSSAELGNEIVSWFSQYLAA
jgi:acetyl esterase/lipase